jgi:hypothetical protein
VGSSPWLWLEGCLLWAALASAACCNRARPDLSLERCPSAAVQSPFSLAARRPCAGVLATPPRRVLEGGRSHFASL